MTDNAEQYLVNSFEAKRITHLEIEIYKSEYRDDEVTGKFYACIQEYDSYGNRKNYWNTDDYDTITELKKGIKTEMNETGVNIKF